MLLRGQSKEGGKGSVPLCYINMEQAVQQPASKGSYQVSSVETLVMERRIDASSSSE